MITRELYIRKYNWQVHVYYAVTCYWVAEIMYKLHNVKCPHDKMKEAYKNLMACKLDTGLTYSNFRKRETVMVIGLTSSPAEFLNSFDHEKKHLEAHIAKALHIDPWGEEIAYLAGETSRSLSKDVQLFMCDCRKHRKEKECRCGIVKGKYGN